MMHPSNKRYPTDPVPPHRLSQVEQSRTEKWEFKEGEQHLLCILGIFSPAGG